MMKKFNEYIKENMIDLLQPKSDEDVMKELKKLDDNDRIQQIIELQSYWEFLPRNRMGICTYFGDLILYGEETEGLLQLLQQLPPNFVVTGDLDVSYNEIHHLPINLRVKGNFDCRANQLTEIPKDLIVDGDLDLDYNYIEELPKSISVGGNIDWTHQETKKSIFPFGEFKNKNER